MNCWKCAKKLDEGMHIRFRTVCHHCDVDLHVCINCKYFAPSKPNDCIVPGIDNIRDKERANLCEEFTPLQNRPSVQIKQKFNDLFK